MIEIFETSAILLDFPHPIKGDNVRFVETVLPPQPIGVEAAIQASWTRELLAKQRELEQLGDKMIIGPNNEPISGNDLDALYEEGSGRRIMWSGPNVTLRGVRLELTTRNPTVWLEVARTHYAYTTGLNNQEVTRLYDEQGIEKPRPPLAICTFAVTPQNEIVLTVRGDRTNKYPRRWYGQGGDPRTPDTDVISHQVAEMRQEILLEPTEYKPVEIEFYALAEDREDLPRKVDLIGSVRIDISFAEIDERVKKRENKPNDAVAVVYIPADAEGLLEHLATVDPKQYCAPAFAGLIVYGGVRHGDNWKRDLRRELHQ